MEDAPDLYGLLLSLLTFILEPTTDEDVMRILAKRAAPEDDEACEIMDCIEDPELLLGADAKQEWDSCLKAKESHKAELQPFKQQLRKLSSKVQAQRAAESEAAGQKARKRRRKASGKEDATSERRRPIQVGSQLEDLTLVQELNRLLPTTDARISQDKFSKRWLGSWGDQTISRSWNLYGQEQSGYMVAKAIWAWYTDATGLECDHPELN